MAIIDSIVNVNISRQTAQVDITSFDIPLLIVEMDNTTETIFTDRVRTYSSSDGVAGDLGTKHNAYKMAVKLFSGDLKPASIKVGKKTTGEDYVQAYTAIQEVDDTWYVVMIDSHEDSDINDVAEIVQAQHKLFFTSTSNPLAYEQEQSVDYTATVKFVLDNAQDGDTLTVRIAGANYTSEMGADVTGEWGEFNYEGGGDGLFGGSFVLDDNTGLLTITNSSPYVVVTASQVIEGGFTGDIEDDNISKTDPKGMDIAQRLKYKGMYRTIVLFSEMADEEFPECSWVGGQLPETVGSITWEYKQLPGTTRSNLTETQINILEDRNYNYYIEVKGVNITRRGKSVGEGEWVD